jgi:hypothetical protein
MTAPTTPPPAYRSRSEDLHPPVSNAVPRMQYPEKSLYRTAASRARTLYPGPVGELVARELLTIEEFGWTLGAGSLGTKLVAAINEAWRAANPTDPPAAGPKPFSAVPHIRAKTASETS